MVHLLEKYSESTVNDDRVLNTAEKRLCRAYYQTKRERENLLGQAARYITVMIKNDKYIPGFDPRYEKEVAALHARAIELEQREEDLLARLDKISGLWPNSDIRSLNEEKRKIEDRIATMGLFPDEQAKMRERHAALSREIDDYLNILKDI